MSNLEVNIQGGEAPVVFHSISDYCNKTLQWLLDERNEEIAEIDSLLKELSPAELQDRGLVLLKLVATDITTGLYGRIIVKFVSKYGRPKNRRNDVGSENCNEAKKSKSSKKETFSILPTHRLTTGDIVGLFPANLSFISPPLCTGVVDQIHDNAIWVAFETDDMGANDSMTGTNTQRINKKSQPGIGSSEFDFSYCDELLNLAILSNGVTTRKQIAVLEKLENAVGDRSPAASVINCCFGISSPKFDIRPINDILNSTTSNELLPVVSLDFISTNQWNEQSNTDLNNLRERCSRSKLNESQLKAVMLSLRSLDVACIHGPPGTGKTTTLIECIRQFVSQGKRVLATAPSNIAVDNLLERCVALGMSRCLRLGHPSRVTDTLRPYLMEHQVRQNESYKLCRDIQSDIDNALKKMNKLRNQKRKRKTQEEYQEHKSIQRQNVVEIRHLRKELRLREKRAIDETLNSCQIVFATCVGADNKDLRLLVHGNNNDGKPFDVVCIDEAAQGLEVACWIPALLGCKLILAGDHRQLPPTVKSARAFSGLSYTLFERLIDGYGDKISQMLSIQYRMHSKIMSWSGDTFYNSQLVADNSVAHRDLASLINVQSSSNIGTTCSNGVFPSPLVWVDTAGVEEAREDQSLDYDKEQRAILWATSKSNHYEAAVVLKYCEYLSALFNDVDEYIGIITPYNAQAELLRRALQKSSVISVRSIPIATVDGFQGRERDVIIMSLVRSNLKHQLGFLSDSRRLNVAVTRAKRHIAIIGDSEIASSDAILKGLFQRALDIGEVVPSNLYVQSEDLAELQTKTMYTKQEAEIARTKRQSQGESRKVFKRHSKERIFQSKPEDQSPKLKKSAELVEPQDEEQSKDQETKFYRKILQRVLASGGSHTFPPSLTSYHRRLIHILAMEIGLLHESIGDGKERCITVRCRKAELGDDKEGNGKIEQSEQIRNSTEVEVGTRKAVENRGYRFEDLSCPTHDDESDMEENEGKKNGTINKESTAKTCQDARNAPLNRAARTKKKKKPPSNQIVDNEYQVKQDEEFDRIIEHALERKWSCFVEECRQSTELLGRVCPFCGQRFCISHALPEVHGCGEEASRNAKKEFRNVYASEQRGICAQQNAGIVRSQWMRDALRTRLDKKVRIAQESRRGKPKKI